MRRSSNRRAQAPSLDALKLFRKVERRLPASIKRRHAPVVAFRKNQCADKGFSTANTAPVRERQFALSCPRRLLLSSAQLPSQGFQKRAAACDEMPFQSSRSVLT